MRQEREWLDEELAGLGEAAATDSDWRNFSDEINGRSDAGYVAQKIHETRDGARNSRRVRAAEPNEVPAERAVYDSAAWDAYRRRLFERHVGQAAKFARAMFGLTGPLPPEDVPQMLTRAREVERPIGDELLLEVPVISEGRVTVAETWTVYRGHAADKYGEREPPQPLGFLASRSVDLASRTGTRPADAVLFLLCDIVVYWPAVSAYVDRRPRFAIVLRAEWPFIEPETVAELYLRTRGSLFGLRHDAPASERLTVGKRVMSAELVQFVARRRQRGETWPSIHAAWTATYPDKPFKTPLSLRSTFLDADKRLPEMCLEPAPWRPED